MIGEFRKYLKNSKLIRILEQFALPALFVVIVYFFFPGRLMFELSGDEGINLMKSLLVDNGNILYDEIWSDQPPLFTYLLSFGFRFVGYKVGFARYIVLAFSFLLLWASGRFLHLVWGKEVSRMGSILIMLLPTYLYLSVAVMIGLPSIALAMISLWAIAKWHTGRKYYWLLISALFMGFAVLIKIFIGFLGPIICTGLLIGEYYYSEKKIKPLILYPSLIWGGIFSFILITAGYFLIGFDNLNQLWDNHVAASALNTLDSKNINNYLKHSLPLVILGIMGAYDSIHNRKWIGLYVLAWATTSYVLLLNHYPVWDHHQLYVTIPLALLAAKPSTEALKRLWNLLSKEISWNFPIILQRVKIICILVILLHVRLPDNVQMLRPVSTVDPESEMDEMTMKYMKLVDLYKTQTNWIVTDKPVVAFRNRLAVPPELAVYSSKRLFANELTTADIIRTIETYQPEQVLIGRFNIPELQSFLDDHYTHVYGEGWERFYIRNDIEVIPFGPVSP